MLRGSWARIKGWFPPPCHYSALGIRLSQVTGAGTSLLCKLKGWGKWLDAGWVTEIAVPVREGWVLTHGAGNSPLGNEFPGTPAGSRTPPTPRSAPSPERSGPRGPPLSAPSERLPACGPRCWLILPPPGVWLLAIPPPALGPSSFQPRLPEPPPRELDVWAAPSAAPRQQPPPPAPCALPRPRLPESPASAQRSCPGGRHLPARTTGHLRSRRHHAQPPDSVSD